MMERRHIAIVGAGLAGLATAYHLLKLARKQEKKLALTIIDRRGTAAAASGMPAALLHPFGGVKGRCPPKAHAALEAAEELFIAADGFATGAVIRTPILRPPLSEEQESSFHSQAEKQPELACWIEGDALKALTKGTITRNSGLLIRSGFQVALPAYLQALAASCEKAGATFLQREVSSLELLRKEGYDQMVLAIGAATAKLLPKLPLQAIKGQSLLLRAEEGALLPPIPIAAKQLFIPTPEDHRTFWLGSSYERFYATEAPEQEVAARHLLPHAEQLIPAIGSAEIISSFAGLRCSAPGHQPLIQQLDSCSWLFTGLGSKGLLWHALLGRQLAEQLLS